MMVQAPTRQFGNVLLSTSGATFYVDSALNMSSDCYVAYSTSKEDKSNFTGTNGGFWKYETSKELIGQEIQGKNIILTKNTNVI